MNGYKFLGGHLKHHPTRGLRKDSGLKINPTGVPRIIDGFVLVSVSNQNTIAAFDLVSGAFRWFHTSQEGAFGWGANKNGVYFVNYKDVFSKLNLETGFLEMTVDIGDYDFGTGWSQVGTVVGNQHFVSFTRSKKLVAFDTNTGKPGWIHQCENDLFAPTSYAYGHLVFSDEAGQVYCMKPLEEIWN